MSEDYYSIILRYDSDGWEYPEDFDYAEEQRFFFEAKDELESLLVEKLDFETGVNIQDASYHSMIKISDKFLFREGICAQIRFSNFGKMISFLNENCINEEIKADMVECLAVLGYTYIPEGVLRVRYAGKNSRASGIDSWWHRYFDWA